MRRHGACKERHPAMQCQIASSAFFESALSLVPICRSESRGTGDVFAVNRHVLEFLVYFRVYVN